MGEVMNKKYIITFSISVLVLFSIAIIAFMLMLPQNTSVIDSSVNKYESIDKSDYQYEQTKDISKDALLQEYTITQQNMESFKNTNQYKPGNSDPFAPSGSSEGGSTGNSTSGGTTSNSTTNSTTSTSQQATTKTTNSNGGVANPPSTNK